MGISDPLIQATLLGEAVEGAAVLVLVLDEDGNHIAVNRHACEVLGYTRDELLQLVAHEVTRQDGARLEFSALVADGFADGLSTITTKDGSELEFHYHASRVEVAGLTLYVKVGRAHIADAA